MNQDCESSNKRGHWYLWLSAITLVPFIFEFFLSWVYGSAGGYALFSQAKIFLLFFEISAITIYFIRHKMKKAAIHLWITVLCLILFSLIVPYLSTHAGVVLDMTDVSGELSTPLYLFLSCLIAAWVLPGKIRWVIRIICVLFMLLYIFIQCTYVGYFELTNSLISVNMLLALAQTNVTESMEYISVNISYFKLISAIIGVLIIGGFVFYTSKFSFNRKGTFSKRIYFFVLMVFLANCLLTAWSVSNTRLAHVLFETSSTLKSFAGYQKILESRKHMKIEDSKLLNELRSVPDGVYVLVIGESLTRDHMNVYGYNRENTPFQSKAILDPHYTFFNHVYSCYTQTVQVLTYALTEKNQYNDIRLADAFSIIDLARQAGFKTTWISNQSRFGIWDTPIGAIGSQCDDQYWINKYIGTGVVTKNYDSALVPFLRKVDPTNRRQLIVIHLMGSHVSYWDRYPKEFYFWPVDQSKKRTKAEIMTDEYDNSVLFNDYVMSQIMNEVTNYIHADGLIYFSDHGELVAERPGHNADQFDYTMVHIPFWVYTSDNYQRTRKDIFNRMIERKNMPFTNDKIYDTLMGMMGLKFVHYDARYDFFSDKYDEDYSDLLTMYGNIWVRNDKEQVGENKDILDNEWNNKYPQGKLGVTPNIDFSAYPKVFITEAPLPDIKNEGLSQENK